MNESEVQDGVEDLKLALLEHPSDRELTMKLGQLYFKNGKPESALSHFYELHQQDREDRVVAEYLLWSALESARPDIAADVVESYGDGRYSSFLQDAQERLLSDPENKTLEFGVAWLCYRFGRFQGAVDGFLAVFNEPKFSFWSANMLGLCYSRPGSLDLGLSLRYLEIALARSGEDKSEEHQSVCYNMAYALGCQGQFSRAIKFCRELSEMDPKYPHLAQLICQLRYGLSEGGDSDGQAGWLARNKPTPPSLDGFNRKRPG